jgi:hypothetical protein
MATSSDSDVNEIRKIPAYTFAFIIRRAGDDETVAIFIRLLDEAVMFNSLIYTVMLIFVVKIAQPVKRQPS